MGTRNTTHIIYADNSEEYNLFVGELGELENFSLTEYPNDLKVEIQETATIVPIEVNPA